MFTDFEKNLYNAYLKESRESKNLPFKRRKHFQKINSTVALLIKKLALFFINNKDVSPTEFFKAPYSVYPEGESFDLKFYASQKAIKVYKIFIESRKSIDTVKTSGKIPSVTER